MSKSSRSIWLVSSQIRPCMRQKFRPCTSRNLTSSARRYEELEEVNKSPGPEALEVNNIGSQSGKEALQDGKPAQPIGSRRRRALAELYPHSIPFEQLPYQCFQEARKVLAADREEKLQQIAEMRARIAKTQSIPAANLGGDYVKKGKLVRMQKHLEELKIMADINDPMIKKRFEDGLADMNRPIYRHLSDQKWRSYKRLLLMERISSFHLVPDIFPHLNPTAAIELSFGRLKVVPGEFVDSRISENAGKLRIQPFDKGERLVSIAIVDPDVPDEANDSFTSRCHFLAVNIPVSPTNTSVPLYSLDADKHIVQPWLPPFAQKGSPYHRLPIFVMQQGEGQVLDVEALRRRHKERDGWRVQRLTEPERLTTIGVHIFRTKWDEGADGVAVRHGIPGANVQLVRKKAEKLPYKKKDGARYR